MGANAVRLPHYQYDQYAYDLADKRGFTVWTEIPLVSEASFDGQAPSAGLAANARRQLTELIRQNYNHPSVALWSIANEIDLKDDQAQRPEQGRRPAARPRRPRASRRPDAADHPGGLLRAIRRTGARRHHDVTDTLGYNRYFGWYYGKPADLGALLTAPIWPIREAPSGFRNTARGAALTSTPTIRRVARSIRTAGRIPKKYRIGITRNPGTS